MRHVQSELLMVFIDLSCAILRICNELSVLKIDSRKGCVSLMEFNKFSKLRTLQCFFPFRSQLVMKIHSLCPLTNHGNRLPTANDLHSCLGSILTFGSARFLSSWGLKRRRNGAGRGRWDGCWMPVVVGRGINQQKNGAKAATDSGTKKLLYEYATTYIHRQNLVLACCDVSRCCSSSSSGNDSRGFLTISEAPEHGDLPQRICELQNGRHPQSIAIFPRDFDIPLLKIMINQWIAQFYPPNFSDKA